MSANTLTILYALALANTIFANVSWQFPARAQIPNYEHQILFTNFFFLVFARQRPERPMNDKAKAKPSIIAESIQVRF